MIARILRAFLEAHYRRHACPDFAYLAEAERIAADLAALGPVVAADFDLGVTA